MKKIVWLAGALLATTLCWAATSAEQAVLWLEGEDPAHWTQAVDSLLAERNGRLPGDALSSVLKRLDALEPAARSRVVGGLGDHLGERRVRDALLNVLNDADPAVRRAALAALTGKHPLTVADAAEAEQFGTRLLALADHDTPALKDILPRVARLYRQQHAAALGVPPDDAAAFRREAARRSQPGTQASPHFERLRPLLEADHWQIRRPAFEAFAQLLDERVDDALLKLTAHRNDYVVGNALTALAARDRLDLACPVLLEWALSPLAARAGERRFQRLNHTGSQCADRQLGQWLTRYRQAANAEEQADYRRLLDHAPLQLPQQRPLLETLRADADPFLRDFARARLAARPTTTAAARGQWPLPVGTGILAAFMAASLLLAVAVFLWGFRMLQLRRLLRHLAVSKARSAGVGLVALEGEVQPLENRALAHPDTEQLCVFYDGADREVPDHHFWLLDDTGRVLVQPRHALLLSEDGVLLPGERVRMIGTARRLAGADADGKAPTVLGSGPMRASAFSRLGRGLLGSVMARRTTHLLFSDPRQRLLIWDDAHGTPFLSARETALIFLSFAFAATWMLIFLAGVAVLMHEGIAATVWRFFGLA